MEDASLWSKPKAKPKPKPGTLEKFLKKGMHPDLLPAKWEQFPAEAEVVSDEEPEEADYPEAEEAEPAAAAAEATEASEEEAGAEPTDCFLRGGRTYEEAEPDEAEAAEGSEEKVEPEEQVITTGLFSGSQRQVRNTSPRQAF